MKMKRLVIYTALAFTLLCAGLRQASADPTISVGTRIPITATTFALPIAITGGVQVISWQFDLAYDPSDVQINTGCDPFGGDPYCSLFTGPVTEGPFFGSLSSFNVFNPGFITLDPTTSGQAGLLLAVNDTFGGDLPGPSGDGVLAYVEFLVTGDGTSPITVQNGSVISAVPEPATLVLLTAGLALLGGTRLAGSRRQDDF